ncbi:hypothetical protein [Clostridium tagluense]|uniref:hypothetical protein n=1 Tax=Clostridium tagluense TaxID=360422 RepID=UPI001C6DEAED|nr:hypothetical protein [Clostridium tagluense]MBW9158863.1 hypothetical protein [Clostridium tagluense]WLC67159.1 hypothetical protein KTC93_08265 [Clostridium tagluense]
MPTITPRLGLKKPLGNETVSRQAGLDNLDILENKVALQSDLVSSLADTSTYSTYKLGIDSNDIYTQVLRKRANGTLIIKSILSGGTSPTYTTKTETKYGADGITVEWTKTYTLTYNTDGFLLSEVLI